MNKRGFTLIELLAVIVILAIIALIATPIILNVIDTARKGSKESSTLGYIDAVEKQVMMLQLDSSDSKIISGVYSVEGLTTLKVDIKGEKPDNTSVVVINNKGAVTEGWFTYEEGKYKVYYDGKIAIASTGDDYLDNDGNSHNTIPTPGETIGGPTKVEATSNDTHKGIVYLDPTDLTKTCTEELANQNVNEFGTFNEIKEGCMKWYIYNDSGSNYKLILDHNTTARIKWNDDNINVAYENSNIPVKLAEDTKNWDIIIKSTVRLISTNEINEITGMAGFDVANTDSYYYLDGFGKSSLTYDSTNRNRYNWINNNLGLCKTDTIDYGCTIEDNNKYTGYGTATNGTTTGRWTQDHVGNSGSGSYVWALTRAGRLASYVANSNYFGICPVIEISKSTIKE